MIIESNAKNHIKALQLLPGEEVLGAVSGMRGKRFKTSGRDQAVNGALVLTNKRISFVRNGFFSDVFEAIPLEKISSVELKEGLLVNHKLYISTSGDDVEFLAICQKAVIRTFIGEIEKARSYLPQANATSTPTVDDPVKRLCQLGELHIAGVLTGVEFEKAKAAIMAQII